MGVLLELLGLALIAGTVYAFLGPVLAGGQTDWPLFWGCAGGALAIIVYRKWSRSRQEGEKNS